LGGGGRGLTLFIPFVTHNSLRFFSIPKILSQNSCLPRLDQLPVGFGRPAGPCLHTTQHTQKDEKKKKEIFYFIL
jgi:hypothetical protein